MIYCGYHKMAEKHTSLEYNLDENSYSEDYKNEGTEDNESKYQILILTLQIWKFCQWV